ncbi:hypothetical protein HC229_06745 [Flavobacterium sp. D33]|nr:hypothetical protein [Flavobacterium selenitireducens]
MEISKSTFLGALLVITMAATAFGVFCKLQGYPETLFVAVGLGTFGIFWIVTLYDIWKSQLKNKTLLLLLTLLIPFVSPVIYFKLREDEN